MFLLLRNGLRFLWNTGVSTKEKNGLVIEGLNPFETAQANSGFEIIFGAGFCNAKLNRLIVSFAYKFLT